MDEKDIIKGNEIELFFNDENKKLFKTNNSKVTYTDSKIYDITIIEINKDDNFNENDMLNVNINILREGKELFKFYEKRPSYIIHYPKGDEIRFSSNLINVVDLQEVIINNLCSTDISSSSAPIIDCETGYYWNTYRP